MAMQVKNTFIQIDDGFEDDIDSPSSFGRQQTEPAPSPTWNLFQQVASLEKVVANPTPSAEHTQGGQVQEDSKHAVDATSTDSTEADEFEFDSFNWNRTQTCEPWDRDPSSLDSLPALPSSEDHANGQYYWMPYASADSEPSDAVAADFTEECDGFTVMIRNVPNRYSRDLLVDELNRTGYLGTFDFLYLPIDPDTGANKGYAFVNFVQPIIAKQFMMAYENRRMDHFGSDKIIQVTPAVQQGFQANYEHFAKKYVNQQDESMRPLFCFGPNSKFPSDMPTTSLLKKKAFRRDGKMSLIDQAVVRKAGGGDAIKFCPYCGGKCRDGFKFCQLCGKSLRVCIGR